MCNVLTYQLGFVRGLYSTQATTRQYGVEMFGRYRAVQAAEKLRSGDARGALADLDRYIAEGLGSAQVLRVTMPELKAWVDSNGLYLAMERYGTKNNLVADSSAK